MRDERFARELKRIQPLSEGFPGYRVLRHYAFDKPGRYKIQAVYEGLAYTIPSDRWPNNLPFPLDMAADIIEDWIGRKNQFRNHVRLRAKSEILDFEVEPWRP